MLSNLTVSQVATKASNMEIKTDLYSLENFLMWSNMTVSKDSINEIKPALYSLANIMVAIALLLVVRATRRQLPEVRESLRGS